MLYSLEQGPVEKEIIDQCVRNRMPLPDRIQNAPELFPGLDWFYNAFMDLSGCRELGYGVQGPIDWLTIQRYCEVYSVEGEQREDMFYHIQRLDRAFLNWCEEKRPKA